MYSPFESELKTDELEKEGVEYRKEVYNRPKPKLQKGGFFPMPNNFMNNYDKLKLHQNETTLLFLFIRSIWTSAHHYKDKLQLHDRYYKNNRLAASWAKTKLAEMFGVDPETIGNWTSKLEQNGDIEVIRKRGNQNVYVVGEVRNGKHFYYCEG